MALGRIAGGDGEREAATHLISFRSCSQDPKKPCNRPLFEQLRHLSQAAAKIPSITQHHLYQGLPPELELNPRWARHVKEGLRGRGFWFWKPALVNLLWENGTLQDGDTVVWADADAQMYLKAPGAAAIWRRALARGRWDVFVKHQPYCEMVWTKADIFEHFGVSWADHHYGLTPQAHAQFWVLRLNPRTRKLMRHWESLMSHFHLVSDERSTAENPRFFKENRHDQSMLSMLLKSNAAQMEPDLGECKYYLERYPGAFNASIAANRSRHRHKTYGIEGLSAKIGDFLKEAAGPGNLTFAETSSTRRHHRPGHRPLLRRICVRGRCTDLDALPRGQAPSGVAAVAA